jgi:hypothetical protein
MRFASICPEMFAVLLLCSAGFATDQLVIVGQPTDHSVSLNVLSPTDTVACVEYDTRKAKVEYVRPDGSIAHSYTRSSPWIRTST